MTEWQPGQPIHDRRIVSAEYQRPIIELLPEHRCPGRDCIYLDGRSSTPAARWPNPFPRQELR